MSEYIKKENAKYVETEYNVDYNKVGFEIKPNISILLGIEVLKPMVYDERWDSVKIYYNGVLYNLDRYYISTYGRCYDTKTCKLLKQHVSSKNADSIPYMTYCMHISDKYEKVEVFIHRIMASTFLPKKDFENVVNHKDGNPSHNYIWNIEWTTESMNYIHCINSGLKVEKLGENRTNAKWTDNEIHEICSLMANGHKATFIYNYLHEKYPDNDNIKYERIRTLYKHIIHKTHWYHISKLYNIDFSKNNYSKEHLSVKNANKRLNNDRKN